MNTNRALKEWHFDFGLCITQDGQSIPEAHCEELLDLITRWAVEKDYGVGGGFREFTAEGSKPFPLRPETDGA